MFAYYHYQKSYHEIVTRSRITITMFAYYHYHYQKSYHYHICHYQKSYHEIVFAITMFANTMLFFINAHAVGSNIDWHLYLSMGKRYHRAWHAKVVVFRCEDCLTERVKELHHTNRRVLHGMRVTKQICTKRHIHQLNLDIEMECIDVAISPVTLPPSHRSVSREMIIEQDTVPGNRRDVECVSSDEDSLNFLNW